MSKTWGQNPAPPQFSNGCLGKYLFTKDKASGKLEAFLFVLILNNYKNMKTINLEPTEFYQFRKLAFAMSIAFVCTIAHGVYIVEANINQLEKLGY